MRNTDGANRLLTQELITMVKKFVLTRDQLQEALRLAAMGGADLLNPSDVLSLQIFPQEVRDEVFASVLVIKRLKEGKSSMDVINIIRQYVNLEKH